MSLIIEKKGNVIKKVINGKLYIYKDGKLIKEVKNMVLNIGLDHSIHRLVDDSYPKIEKLVVGDGTDTVEATQTGITGNYVNSNDVTVVDVDTGIIWLVCDITGGSGGETHKEAALYTDFSDFSTDSPIAYSRLLYPEEIQVAENEIITYVWEIQIKREGE